MQRIDCRLLLTGCFLAALCGCRAASAPPTAEVPPLNVPVATPVERTITDYEEYTGKIMSVERVNVTEVFDETLGDDGEIVHPFDTTRHLAGAKRV